MKLSELQLKKISNFLIEFKSVAPYLVKMANQERKDKLGDNYEIALLISNSFNNIKPSTEYSKKEVDHLFETCVQNARYELGIDIKIEKKEKISNLSKIIQVLKSSFNK